MLKQIFTDFSNQAAFKTCWAGIASGCCWLIGGFGEMLLALFVLYLIDFALGFYSAWINKSISREKIHSGLRKIPLYALVIISAQQLDNIITINVPTMPFLGGGVRGFIIAYAGVTEMLSVCTHLHGLGMRLPLFLVERLNCYRDKMDGKKEIQNGLG